MAVKYQCEKCDRRFVDWGAEKLGYKCPECEGAELVRIGAAEEPAPKVAPKLKRKKTTEAPSADKVPEMPNSNDEVLTDDSEESDDSYDELDSNDETVVDDEPLD